MRGSIWLGLVIALLAVDARADDCNTNGFEDSGEFAPFGVYTLDLDGVDDYVGCGAGQVFDIKSKFTVEAWVRPASTTGVRRIVSKGPTDGYGFGQNGGKLRFTTYGIKDYDTAGVYLSVGVWTHVAVVFDQFFDAHFYVNGGFVETVAGSTDAHLNSAPLEIGRAAGNTEFWNGQVSEVRVWNLVRTSQQIADSWDQSLVGNEPGLVAYWRLDEGSGTLADDSAGTKDGTLTNGAGWYESPADCNTNTVPDACELEDCNTDGVGDLCQSNLLDCDTNGVPDLCQPDCDTDGIIDACETYPASGTNDTDAEIPDDYYYGDAPPLLSDIELTADATVVDVNVGVFISHNFTQDLDIFVSHDGVTVELATDIPGDDFDVLFDDEADDIIQGGQYHVGTFRPEGHLYDLDGLNVAGVWTLSVEDDSETGIGTLLGWSVHVTHDLLDCNTNTVPDECELEDCNTDGVRDLCQPDYVDCDTNGTFDACDIGAGSAADCNDNGRPDICDLYVATGPTVDVVRSVDLAFPDLVERTDSLTIDDTTQFNDVEVSLVVTHPFMGDTQYWLDRDGASIPLMYNLGADSDNADILFDDDADGSPPPEGPLTGTYLPQWPLDSLIPGGNSTGVWTVHCLDTYDGSGSGVLNQWALHLSALEVISGDCNTDSIPDECQDDCNTNALPDDCEWADCNTNELMDVCESQGLGKYDSGVLSPMSYGATQTYTFTPVQTYGDVSFTFQAKAGIALGQFIDIYLNGEFAWRITQWEISYCSGGSTTFVYPQDAFNTDFVGSPLTIEMISHPEVYQCVDEEQGFHSNIRAVVGYDQYAAIDCDTNGVPDECQPQDDVCQPNGVPDVCDADCNSNGEGDACETAEADCNTSGVPDDCEGGCNTNGIPDECEVAADCNTDGLIDACDLDDVVVEQPGDAGFSLFAMDTSDAGMPEASAKIWDQLIVATETHLWNGTAAFSPLDWGGFATIPFLVEIATAPGGTEAGGEVMLSTFGTGRTDGSGIVDFDFNGALLAPGTWWISVQATGGVGSYGTAEWLLSLAGPPTGGLYWHNPGEGWGYGPDPVFFDGIDAAFTLYTIVDCNTNMIPDVCEEDCNGNGRHDDCDPDYGDCNTNGTEDSCEPDFADCNTNLVKDECDIASGSSGDCNTDGVPQECEGSDCNTNGLTDACDFSGSTSDDCDTNGSPDECEGDCNTNGVDDTCDLTGEPDCNTNGVPDVCDVFPWDGYMVQFMSLDSHVHIAAAPELDMDAALTLEAWVFPIGRGGHPDEGGTILCKDGEYGLARFPDGVTRFSLADSVGWGWRYTPIAAPEGQWTHVALTYNGQNIRFYRNGSLVGATGQSASAIGDAIPEFNDLLIGNRQAHAAAFDGRIDDVRVWNVVRSDSEIQAGYNQPLTGNEPGLVGYWRFDDGSGATAADTAGGDHPGTLVDGAIWSPHVADCNTNGIPDECDIASGEAEDCNTNGLPDACDGDCNGDGLADLCNILFGSSQDCNTNTEADECEGDCNTNGIPDPCEPDCNGNSYPDDCEGGCNSNGIPDECEVDCNTNDVTDACDIGSGSSPDCDTNAVPDECDLHPPAEPSDYSHDVGSLFGELLADSIVVEQIAPFDDLNVEIRAYHDNIGQTFFYLGRDETLVLLMAQDGGQTDVAFVLFDDEAASEPPPDGPLIGTFKPTQSLAAFEINPDQAGTWTLYAQDLYGGTGYLQSWSLHFSRTPDGDADCNTNEVADECDLDGGMAADCNTNGAPDGCDMASPFVINTAVSSPNLAIPDFGEVTDSIAIDEEAAFDDLNVALVVTHPFARDLDFRLDKAGTTIDLLFGDGNDPNCLVLLDDEAATPPPSDRPMIGTFQPAQPLSAFDADGQQAGTWTLHCIDTFPGSGSGVLEEWALHFGLQSDDCNTNGAPDECDLADGESSDSNGDGVPDECGESIAGDLNCDGLVDAADVPFFVQALLDPAAFDGCDIARADLNGDSLIDGADVQPFANIVLGP